MAVLVTGDTVQIWPGKQKHCYWINSELPLNHQEPFLICPPRSTELRQAYLAPGSAWVQNSLYQQKDAHPAVYKICFSGILLFCHPPPP